jgi:hypothetical protein
MAMALGVPDAVSMTRAELEAAVERERAARHGGARVASDALGRARTKVESLERMLADEVAVLTAAVRDDEAEASRRSDALVRDAERRAAAIVADAERERAEIVRRADRYAARVKRLADRAALRRAP